MVNGSVVFCSKVCPAIPYALHIPDATVPAHKVCVAFGVVGFVIHEGMRVEGVGAGEVLLTLLTVISSLQPLVVRHSYNANQHVK